MIGKTVLSQKQSVSTVALVASLLWLAACAPAVPASTAQPTAEAVEATATTAPAESETDATETPAEEAPEAEASEAEASEAEAPETIVKINLNTATEEEFLTVPNSGERMAHEFEEYRPYISIQQFRQEIGKYVDEAQVAAYEEYLYVPVVPNTSDAETLQQLPGVTPEIAEELIAGRPYDSNAAFLEALAGHVTEEELTIGESYLESE